MLFLMVIILSSLLFIYFAFQNTTGVTITVADYRFMGVPLYLLMLISLLAGIFISWVLSTIDAITTGFTLHKKDTTITQASKAIDSLKEKIHELEKDNTRLRAERNEYAPSLPHRIKHSLTM